MSLIRYRMIPAAFLLLAAAAACPAPANAEEAKPAAANATPLTEWYFADALAFPLGTKPEEGVHGALGASLQWYIIFNLSDKPADVTVTYYFENTAPEQHQRQIAAHSTESFGGHDLPPNDPRYPQGKLYGVRVQSTQPVVVQATRAEEEAGVKPPEMPGRSFLSELAYPGPLGKRETVWAYADSFFSRDNPRAKEWEWMTVLNPNPDKDAKVKVTFNYAKGSRSFEFVVAAERVRTIDLQQEETALNHQHAGVIVESDVPVIAEQLRRYSFRSHPAPAGLWIVRGYPLGDMKGKLPILMNESGK